MNRPASSPPPVRAYLLAGFVAAAVCAVGPAWAAAPAASDEPQKTRVLLVPMQRADDVSSIITNRVGDYLRTILEMNGKLALFAPDTLEKPDESARQRAAETDPTLVAADAALWAAKEAATKSDFTGAVEKFKDALALYDKGLAHLVDFDKLVDAALGVSLAYFMAGYDDNGEDALSAVLVMRPELILDKRKVPAAAAAALERLRKVADTTTLGTTTVQSNPPGADVYLDGVKVGATPWSKKGLVRGRHYVRVVADGYEPEGRSWFANNNDQKLSFKLASNGKATAGGVAQSLPQTPEGLAVAAAQGTLGAPFLQLAGAISKEYGLDAIVLTYVRKGPSGYEIAPFLYDADAGAVAELEWIKLDSELASMQVNLLVLEEKLLAALETWPKSRVLQGQSRIYDHLVAAQPAQPQPVAEPQPAPQPQPVVAQPQPEPSVVRAEPVAPADLGLGGGYGEYTDADLVATRGSRSGKRAWRWVLVGLAGAAVAGGVAAVILTRDSGSSSQPGFSTTVTW
ncbi:MAG: PEGA domain-containing protein [Deltaproteobacteria bacterium]|nr:PEGA domain-containing protein [Deltaproteobacteria bacterium]MCB9785534.1 PEGA domain-containing protein [Deltaproteobacteria bacterium]